MPELPKTCDCPYCGQELCGATDPVNPEGVPVEGDASICIGCGGLLIFNEDLTSRKPTAAEYAALCGQVGKTIAQMRWAHRSIIGNAAQNQ
jgi:hypothetical protein